MAIREITRAERLGRLAKLLQAKREPYYVTHPLPPGTLRRDFPSEGWYWVPAGATSAQLLARDSYDAYHHLLSLVEAADQEEE